MTGIAAERNADDVQGRKARRIDPEYPIVCQSKRRVRRDEFPRRAILTGIFPIARKIVIFFRASSEGAILDDGAIPPGSHGLLNATDADSRISQILSFA